MAPQFNLHIEAHAQAELKPTMFRKFIAPAVLAVAVYGSASLEVGVSLSYSYAV